MFCNPVIIMVPVDVDEETNCGFVCLANVDLRVVTILGHSLIELMT